MKTDSAISASLSPIWRVKARGVLPRSKQISSLIDAASHPSMLWSALWPLLEKRWSDAAFTGAVFTLVAWCLTDGARLVKVCALDGFYRRLPASDGVQRVF